MAKPPIRISRFIGKKEISDGKDKRKDAVFQKIWL